METKIQIIKFGGTSVGSGERIRRVANIITHKVHDTGEAFPVVVVSAMSGVTDQLLRIARFAYTGEHHNCETELNTLKQKQLEAAQNLFLKHEDRYSQLIDDLEKVFSALQQDITELQLGANEALTHEISLRTAAVAAWGERLSVLLVAAAVCNNGIDAVPIREEAIITGHPVSEIHQTPGTVTGA